MNIPRILFRTRYARALAAGCVAAATGGIVLLRAPGHSAASSSSGVTVRTSHDSVAPRVEFSGPGLTGRLALAQGSVLAHGARQLYAELRVGSHDAATHGESRPVALALVLDTSGSMAGEKIEQARAAVLEVIERMRDRDDIAFITYSDTQVTVQPLARVSDVRESLRRIVPTVMAGGGTVIPRALDVGAAALASAPETFVKRIVLISDGQDGSGEPLPQVEEEVRQRANRGITLSSLGVGTDYDERFMTGMADYGRGNYEFLREASQLRGFLARELQQAESTTVDNVVASVGLPDGWHFRRAYGAQVEASGSTIRVPIGALSTGDERRIVLDLEVDAGAAGDLGSLGVNVAYRSVALDRMLTVNAGGLALRSVESEADANASRDVTVYAEAETAAIAARQTDAVNEWRAGNTRAAAEHAQQNADALRALNAMAPAAAIVAQSTEYDDDARNFAQIAAGSEGGRRYGLRSNAANRVRQQHVNAF